MGHIVTSMSPKLPASTKAIGQLELDIQRERERDRNFHLGGRSFYFFDFDDNVAHVPTPLYLFEKNSGKEISVSSAEFAIAHSQIGKAGIYQDYEINFDDETGTFRCFRDQDFTEIEKTLGKKQIFVEDLLSVLGLPDMDWKGPSWSCFYHAAFNQRPVSVITARGHHPDTIKEGIEVFKHSGFLPAVPNYLSVFPVSHKPTRMALGDTELTQSVAKLKQAAIRASVHQAINTYGYSPHHRFGMSDDDPKNIELIIEEMKRLKTDFPEMSFFIIETHKGDYLKREISISTLDVINKIEVPIKTPDQITLFHRS